MKIVTIENIVLQFDVEDNVEITEGMIQSQIDMVNTILSDTLTWSDPQLIYNKEHCSKVVLDCNPDKN